MSSLRDKLARLHGLRPASALPSPMPRSAGPLASARLVELLAARSRSTASGAHLAVERRFAGFDTPRVQADSVRVVAPEAPAEAADLSRWLLLDTETTGLAGGTGTYAFLIGLAWWDDGALGVEQLFMHDHSEERSLLEELARRVEARPVLVTFNGKSFDWPLVETRYRMARFPTPPRPAGHLDLLHCSRQLWRLRLGSVRLVDLETHVLGMRRGYDIPSELIPRRYFDFLRGGRAEPLADVFRHNEADLRGLARLACRIFRLLEPPHDAARDALELYGLSRLYRRREAEASAERLYERALAAGLPEALDRSARAELAALCKHGRNYARATALWSELAEATAAGIEAYEELAIYYEHRARDFARAAATVERALAAVEAAARAGRLNRRPEAELRARLERRRARIGRKLARQDCQETAR